MHLPQIVGQILIGLGSVALIPALNFIWRQLTPDKKIDVIVRKWAAIFSATLGKIKFVNIVQNWIEFGNVRASISWAIGLRKDNSAADNKELAKWMREGADELEKE